ncbi:hypothetical protein T484DRAFT_1759558, partial [Baffinella frigidus]
MVLVMTLSTRSHAASLPTAFAAFFRPPLPTLATVRPPAVQARRAFALRTFSSRTLHIIRIDPKFEPGAASGFFMGPEPPDGPPVKRGRGRPRKDGLPPVQRKSPEPERAEGVDAADGAKAGKPEGASVVAKAGQEAGGAVAAKAGENAGGAKTGKDAGGAKAGVNARGAAAAKAGKQPAGGAAKDGDHAGGAAATKAGENEGGIFLSAKAGKPAGGAKAGEKPAGRDTAAKATEPVPVSASDGSSKNQGDGGAAGAGEGGGGEGREGPRVVWEGAEELAGGDSMFLAVVRLLRRGGAEPASWKPDSWSGLA